MAFKFNRDQETAPIFRKEAGKLLEQITPLLIAMQRYTGYHLVQKGLGKILEFSCYLLALLFLVLPFLLERIFPFHILGDLRDKQEYLKTLSAGGDLELFIRAVKGLVAGIGVFWFILGWMIRRNSNRRTLMRAARRELEGTERFLSHLLEHQVVEETPPAE
ncbi:MAG TPA: hypothetical protein PLP34_02970 [Chitinophagaceae bacterium]|nr:hypothetical protein [Chitinophagaceae bacterium]